MKAEELARTYFARSGRHKAFLEAHCKAVRDCALLLAEGKDLDTQVLEEAAWLHDIGYSRVQQDGSDMKKHPDYSIGILNEEGYQISDKLRDCILNHGIDQQPETEEGKIFRIADKAAIFDLDTLKVFLNMPNQALPFLQKLASGGYDLMEEYKQ